MSVLIIEKDNMTVEDTKDNLIETEEGITCGCGTPDLQMTCHVDETDYCCTQYKCKCGNTITVDMKRDEEDRW